MGAQAAANRQLVSLLLFATFFMSVAQVSKTTSHIQVLTSLVSACRFGQLQAVDVEGVAPAVRADVGEDNVLRPDIPVKYDAR